MSSSDGGADLQAEVPEKEAIDEDLLTLPKEMLLDIVNRLDPKSFLKLASTCKYLLNFCQNSKGIHVVFKVPRLYVETDWEGNILYTYFFHHFLPPHEDDLETSRKYMGQLRKWPFSICIDIMRMFDLGPSFTWNRVDEEIKAHLLTIGLKKIRYFYPYRLETALDAEHLTKFVKTFDIEDVDLFQVVPEEAFKACLMLPVSNLRMLGGRRDSNFDVDSYLHCSIPTVFLEVIVNLEQFEKIMEVWMTRNGLKSWRFYYGSDSFNIMSYFDDWETLSFASAGPIDPNRCLVFMDDSWHRKKSFYLLRKDGKVLRIVLRDGVQHLSRRRGSSCPPIPLVLGFLEFVIVFSFDFVAVFEKE